MFCLQAKVQFLCLLFCISSTIGQTYLRADGVTNTYALIDSVYGGSGTVVEVPDCNHTAFGPHITQVQDPVLGRHVFAFHSHIRQDDDRCQKFDRQRTEIKTYDKSPANLVGYNGDRVTLSWNFKLDAGFLPPYSFCHVHQLKAKGGDDSMPLITITTRRSNPNEIQLLQYDSKGALHFLATAPLAAFLGEWVHAVSDIVYGSNGSYFIALSRLSDGLPLLSYQSNDIDFWRNQTEFIRPKWGIYRSVQEAVLSRDEIVLFDNFCVAKGSAGICM
jgi:hypothetical protein